MNEFQGDIFSITFDFDVKENNPALILKNLSTIIDNFELLASQICKNINDDIIVSSYLLDIEKGSIKLKCRDLIKNINDNTLMGIGEEVGQKVGSILIKAKHLVVSFLSEAQELSEKDRKEKLFKEMSNLLEKSNLFGSNSNFSKENKKELLKIYNNLADVSNNIKKTDKITLESKNETSSFPQDAKLLAIDAAKELKPTILQKVKVKIKKPAYEGNSQWSIQYRKTHDVSIKDIQWLQKFQNAEINCPPKSWLEVDLEETISIDENEDVIGDPKYDIIKVHNVILPDNISELFK